MTALICSFYMQGQNDTLYLYVDAPLLSYSCQQSLSFGFAISSADANFDTDYFKFDIPNLKGLSPEGEVEYHTNAEIRKKKALNPSKLRTIEIFTKGKAFWEIHNELSLKRKIYLVTDIEGQSEHPMVSKNLYYVYPLIYTGTRKNVVVTDNRKIKK